VPERPSPPHPLHQQLVPKIPKNAILIAFFTPNTRDYRIIEARQCCCHERQSLRLIDGPLICIWTPRFCLAIQSVQRQG